jgi:hypothetical protein
MLGQQRDGGIVLAQGDKEVGLGTDCKLGSVRSTADSGGW